MIEFRTEGLATPRQRCAKKFMQNLEKTAKGGTRVTFLHFLTLRRAPIGLTYLHTEQLLCHKIERLLGGIGAYGNIYGSGKNI